VEDIERGEALRGSSPLVGWFLEELSVLISYRSGKRISDLCGKRLQIQIVTRASPEAIER
jgi:hypothetical protein